MNGVLLATDSDRVFAAVDGALATDDHPVFRVARGDQVQAAVAQLEPSLVLLDLQIGNMGGVAVCLNLRQDESMGVIERRPIGLLLDRAADVFLAQESNADGWLIKPLDSIRLSRLETALLAGTTSFEGLPVDA